MLGIENAIACAKRGIKTTIIEFYPQLLPYQLDLEGSEVFTQFSFSAFDSEPDTLNPVNAVIKIQSTGPNGDESINIFGTSR